MYETLETVLHSIIEYSIVVFELIGTLIIIIYGIVAIKDFITKNHLLRIHLAGGMSLGLTFFLAGEILHTIIAKDLKEIAAVGCIAVLRAALTVLIHWEAKNESDDIHRRQEEEGKF